MGGGLARVCSTLYLPIYAIEGNFYIWASCKHIWSSLKILKYIYILYMQEFTYYFKQNAWSWRTNRYKDQIFSNKFLSLKNIFRWKFVAKDPVHTKYKLLFLVFIFIYMWTYNKMSHMIDLSKSQVGSCKVKRGNIIAKAKPTVIFLFMAGVLQMIPRVN